jgi:AraC family transcriptional regulator, regulatory protein of adaptative response / methylated-DNA-[protein]-cysteine methyltransferase
LEAVLALLKKGSPLPPIAVDILGTAFQRRVWDALLQIPQGQTMTYAEVARAAGRPRATRAVARACAANPLALVIPCHRVVGSDRNRGGYRWGEKRKAALLALEKARRGG